MRLACHIIVAVLAAGVDEQPGFSLQVDPSTLHGMHAELMDGHRESEPGDGSTMFSTTYDSTDCEARTKLATNFELGAASLIMSLYTVMTVVCFLAATLREFNGAANLSLRSILEPLNVLPTGREMVASKLGSGLLWQARVEYIRKATRAEALFEHIGMLGSVLIGCFGAWTRQWGSVPAWTMALLMLLAARGKLVEAQLAESTVWRRFRDQPFDFILNLPKHVDGSACALAIVCVWCEGDSVQHSVLRAWWHNSVTCEMVPILERWHLAGCAAASLALGVFWQICCVINSSNPNSGRDHQQFAVARIAGFGSVYKLQREKAEGEYMESLQAMNPRAPSSPPAARVPEKSETTKLARTAHHEGDLWLLLLQTIGEHLPMLEWLLGFVIARGTFWDNKVIATALIIVMFVAFKSALECTASILRGSCRNPLVLISSGPVVVFVWLALLYESGRLLHVTWPWQFGNSGSDPA